MNLAVKYNGLDAFIIGYCPDESGSPQAIMICEGTLVSDYLCNIELNRLPKKLRKSNLGKNFRRPKKFSRLDPSGGAPNFTEKLSETQPALQR